MSEYQRYEFMTIDRPLTREQIEAVDSLSSHIEVTPTSAYVEYSYGDFKHDPVEVLRDYFDGFLYWANWGSPQLAFRFLHGVLPTNLLDDYDLEDFATFTQHSDYDILNILFGEMEPPDMWTEYDLGSLIAIREELMEGDSRSESADHFDERQAFDAYVQGWMQHHLRRPSLLKRLQDNKFPVSPR